MSRDDFMEFFRDDEKLNTLSTDDRVEIFQTILSGSTDITADRLNNLISDYAVENLQVTEMLKK